jgi:translation initiation factor 5A
MGDEPHEFQKAESGASYTYPMQASALKKGSYCVIKGFPCKIVEMSTSKTGKHGHAKVNLVGIDIFTGKKYEDVCPSSQNVEVPFVDRTDYQLIDITDEDPPFVSLLKPDGSTKDDLRLPEGELGAKLKEDFESGKDIIVTVQRAMGIEAIVSYKENTGSK